METTKQQLEAFFRNYEKIYNDALNSDKVDPEATVACFAPCFVEASPVGIICGKNDHTFQENITKGFQFYKSIGTTAMNLVGTAITLLDDYHAMVKVHWEAAVTRKDSSEVKLRFYVIYMLQVMNGEIKIFAYIAEDEQQAYKDHNIEPYK